MKNGAAYTAPFSFSQGAKQGAVRKNGILKKSENADKVWSG